MQPMNWIPVLRRVCCPFGLYLALVLVLVLLCGGGERPTYARLPDPPALVHIRVRNSADLERVAATGLPVYARLLDLEGQEYLLAQAGPVQQEELSRLGLSLRVLDPDPRQATYYLVYPMPGRFHLDWGAYGRVLFDDGIQMLLRVPPQDAERLAEAGAELRALTLEPKPLRLVPDGWAWPSVIEPDPLIQSMIDQVDGTDVYSYTGGLSGEWEVTIGGAPYTIVTRHTYSGVPVQKATQFVGEHLEALGLDVEYHEWNTSRPPNVIAELPGRIYPEQIVILCGHLDDMPGGPVAPGADDNASGSVAVLIAADILTQYQWSYTLRFALWTGEEQGLLGSHAYAQRAYHNGEDIVGVLNLDMIAWNTLGSNPDIDLHAKSSLPETLDLADLFADVVDAYSLNLVPEIRPNGTGLSDHASFWAYGYTALLGIEDFDDFNLYYHTTSDLLATLDMDYYTHFVKASVGTFAHMGIPLGPSGYLGGTVYDLETSVPVSGTLVQASLSPTMSWSTTTGADGVYQLGVLSGTYTVTASAAHYFPYVTTGITVGSEQTTTLDIPLQPYCLLVVDDDGGDGYETYYTSALDRLGYSYRLTETPPDLADLSHYQGVIWLTGDQGDGTLTAADRSNLAAYLDGAGRLFLSGQDVGLEVGDTAFYGNYLHAVYDSDDTDAYDLTGLDFLSGLDVTIWGAGGANNQARPSDVSPTNGGLAVYDYADPHLYAGVAYSGTYRTVYFAFGYEAVDSQADRDAVMDAVLGYLGVCGEPEVPQASFASTSPDLFGVTTIFTNTTQGTPWITYTWDFGDETALGSDANPTHLYAQPDLYTVVLTATSRYGRSSTSETVVVEPGCAPVWGVSMAYDPPEPLVGQPVTFSATVGRSSQPITYTWAFGDGGLGNGQVVTHTFPLAATVQTYTVTLTVCNACTSPGVEVKKALTVRPRYIYLPAIVKSAMP